jgi:hypothetical protein
VVRRPPIWLIVALPLLCAVGWYCRKQVSHETFLYAGSDTYGYLKLADELYANGRYALEPSPEPLHYARTPLYPIFLAAVKKDRPARMNGGPGWWPMVDAQRWVDLFLTGIFVYFIAAGLRGRKAGVLAYGMDMIFPFTMVFFAAIFTETLAICLTAAAFAMIASGSRAFERVRHFAAGGMAALGTLLRPDGILVLPPLLLGAWLLPLPRRARLLLGAWLVIGFAVVFAPWPIRNLVQFGQPFPFGTRVDRYSHPVPFYAGYYNWLGTWAVDQSVNPTAAWCFYDPNCTPQLYSYPANAFDSPDERKEVDRLLALRRSEHFTERVSDGFEDLARARRRHHPIDNFILLPARRAWAVWINDHSDITHSRQPWPEVWNLMSGHWETLARWFCMLVVFSSAFLLWAPETRRLAAVLFGAIALRTAFLAYFLYVEPRYTLEVMPLGLCLIAGAVVLAAERLRRRIPA